MEIRAQLSADVVRERVFKSLEQMPPFSPVLNRLLRVVTREDVSLARIAGLIENDAVLAGNVLRLVNSPLYGFAGMVNSVRHGVAILGVKKLRNIALTLSIARVWTQSRTPSVWNAGKFNLHSTATGLLADLLVQRSAVPYPEGAFTAGLLHDLGKLLLALTFPDDLAAIYKRREQKGCSSQECELEALGVTHSELSGMALARWNLPEPIQRAVLFHHAPDDADQGRLHLSHAIYAADQLSTDLGYPSTDACRQSPTVRSSIFDALEVGDRAGAIIDEFQAEFDVLKAFV